MKSAAKKQKTGPVKWKCTHQGCDYETDRKNDFQKHLDAHQGVKFNCSPCTKTYGSKRALLDHFRWVHLKQDMPQCQQPNCNFSTNDHGVLRVHLYNEHSIGTAPVCSACPRRVFTNWRVFARHMESYHKEKDYQCPTCKMWYKGEEKLENIWKQHMGLTNWFVISVGNSFLKKLSHNPPKQAQIKKGNL